MRLIGHFLVAAFAGATLLALSSYAALADKRVALVVGNSSYQNVAKLPNPSSDASAIAEMFRKAGFDVVDLQLDAGNLEFKRAIRRFEDAASGADMAVAFFAGHGLELKGTNYMIPIDARLADERDAPDEAIALDRIVEAVDGQAIAPRNRCLRDSPFAVTARRHPPCRTSTRSRRVSRRYRYVVRTARRAPRPRSHGDWPLAVHSGQSYRACSTSSWPSRPRGVMKIPITGRSRSSTALGGHFAGAAPGQPKSAGCRCEG